MLDALTENDVLGPTYLPVWRKVFSPQHPLITLRRMVAKVVAQAGGSSLPPHAALCFRGEEAAQAACPAGLTHAVPAVAPPASCLLAGHPSIQNRALALPLRADTFFSVHGGISILSRSIHSPTPCANSTFIRAMTHFITDGLKLTDVRPASHGGSTSAAAGAPATQQIEEAVLQQAVGGRLMLPGHRSEVAAAAAAAAAVPVSSNGAGQAAGKLRVVWALRSSRAERQEEILDLLNRELPKQGIEVRTDGMLGCRVGGGNGRAPVGVWHCVAAPLACLCIHSCPLGSTSCAHQTLPALPLLLRWQFAALDFGQLPLEEQIRQARSADVLAGYHGAALTLACFMDPPAALVEVEEEWRCTRAAGWLGDAAGMSCACASAQVHAERLDLVHQMAACTSEFLPGVRL